MSFSSALNSATGDNQLIMSLPGSVQCSNDTENAEGRTDQPISDVEDNAKSAQDGQIIVNVRGSRFIIPASDLKKHPQGFLASLEVTDKHFDRKAGEFVFNRNPYNFQSILDFYVRGTLHFPGQLCHEVIKEELKFWRLPPEVLAPCCLDAYQQAIEDDNFMEDLQDAGQDLDKGDSFSLRCWRFLEYPRSSKGALVSYLVQRIPNSHAHAYSQTATLEEKGCT